MKKLSFLLSFCLFIFLVQAQEQTFTGAFDRVFKNVGRAEATTGILYERVLPFAQLHKFNSNLSNVDTGNYEHFLQSYSELYKATFIPVNTHFPFNIDSLKSLIKENLEMVDIGILHFRFNSMDSVVARQKLYFGADSVLFENNAVRSSLYVEKIAFVVSPLKRSMEVGSNTFRFRDILRFDNTDNLIVSLKVDFDDGLGVRQITNEVVPVSYAATGM
jgi:hypothetical protein